MASTLNAALPLQAVTASVASNQPGGFPVNDLLVSGGTNERNFGAPPSVPLNLSVPRIQNDKTYILL
jgi:hypothetical protein